MYNDTISDFLTRIRNAFTAKKSNVVVRRNTLVASMAQILKNQGHINSVTENGLELVLDLNLNLPISHIKRLSKPGIRRYAKTDAIPYPRSGFGIVIVSTPKGVLTGSQARKQKVGGELICEVW